jgi:hypothetical protein
MFKFSKKSPVCINILDEIHLAVTFILFAFIFPYVKEIKRDKDE